MFPLIIVCNRSVKCGYNVEKNNVDKIIFFGKKTPLHFFHDLRLYNSNN